MRCETHEWSSPNMHLPCPKCMVEKYKREHPEEYGPDGKVLGWKKKMLDQELTAIRERHEMYIPYKAADESNRVLTQLLRAMTLMHEDRETLLRLLDEQGDDND